MSRDNLMGKFGDGAQERLGLLVEQEAAEVALVVEGKGGDEADQFLGELERRGGRIAASGADFEFVEIGPDGLRNPIHQQGKPFILAEMERAGGELEGFDLDGLAGLDGADALAGKAGLLGQISLAEVAGFTQGPEAGGQRHGRILRIL